MQCRTLRWKRHLRLAQDIAEALCTGTAAVATRPAPLSRGKPS